MRTRYLESRIKTAERTIEKEKVTAGNVGSERQEKKTGKKDRKKRRQKRKKEEKKKTERKEDRKKKRKKKTTPFFMSWFPGLFGGDGGVRKVHCGDHGQVNVVGDPFMAPPLIAGNALYSASSLFGVGQSVYYQQPIYVPYNSVGMMPVDAPMYGNGPAQPNYQHVYQQPNYQQQQQQVYQPPIQQFSDHPGNDQYYPPSVPQRSNQFSNPDYSGNNASNPPDTLPCRAGMVKKAPVIPPSAALSTPIHEPGSE